MVFISKSVSKWALFQNRVFSVLISTGRSNNNTVRFFVNMCAGSMNLLSIVIRTNSEHINLNQKILIKLYFYTNKKSDMAIWYTGY